MAFDRIVLMFEASTASKFRTRRMSEIMCELATAPACLFVFSFDVSSTRSEPLNA